MSGDHRGQGQRPVEWMTEDEAYRISWAAELGMMWSVVWSAVTLSLLGSLWLQPDLLSGWRDCAVVMAWMVLPYLITGLAAFWVQQNRKAGWLALIATWLAGPIGIGTLGYLKWTQQEPEVAMNYSSPNWTLLGLPILQFVASAPLLLAAFRSAQKNARTIRIIGTGESPGSPSHSHADGPLISAGGEQA